MQQQQSQKMAILIQSSRLQLSSFQLTDAEEVFGCITLAITTFMPWEPPASFPAYKAQVEERLRTQHPNDFSFVIRKLDNNECLGLASLEDTNTPSPEVGLWIKEAAHGQGYGSEVVKVIIEWAAQNLGKNSFIYPVATENIASRKIAETMRGEVIETRTNPKYNSVVYKITSK